MKIREFKPFNKGNLIGIVTVELTSGLIIVGVTILAGARGPWASPPSKPMLDRDSVALKDNNGKLRYQPIIEFASREVRSKWSDQIIGALKASHPEAFQ